MPKCWPCPLLGSIDKDKNGLTHAKEQQQTNNYNVMM